MASDSIAYRIDTVFEWCVHNYGKLVSILFGTPLLVGVGIGWLLRGCTRSA